jgi:PDZ domain-containing secreted protein
MSEQSRSVANDLLRLEMQLAMVRSHENGEDGTHLRNGGSTGGSVGGNSRTSRTSRNSSAARRSAAITKRSKITVVAPPGKLGIILANKADSKGTVVSGVRTSSVLAEKISPGDRIVAIDGEDVSRMTVSEITTIMARKSEFEQTLSVFDDTQTHD